MMNKKIDAPIEFDKNDRNITANESGDLFDSNGNMLKIDETKKHSLLINRSKKQQEIYKQMKKQAKKQNTTSSLLYDNMLPIAKNKKEKR